MQARWMHVESGRFISPDPEKQGINYYIYAQNNPTSMIDPDGRYSFRKSTNFLFNFYFDNNAFTNFKTFKALNFNSPKLNNIFVFNKNLTSNSANHFDKNIVVNYYGRKEIDYQINNGKPVLFPQPENHWVYNFDSSPDTNVKKENPIAYEPGYSRDEIYAVLGDELDKNKQIWYATDPDTGNGYVKYAGTNTEIPNNPTYKAILNYTMTGNEKFLAAIPKSIVEDETFPGTLNLWLHEINGTPLGKVAPIATLATLQTIVNVITSKKKLNHTNPYMRDVVKSNSGTKGTRRQAFNQAKRDAGINRTQNPLKVKKVPMTDRSGHVIKDANGKIITTREYYFQNNTGNNIVIQEHSAGHFQFGEGPHFNVRPITNTRTGKVPGVLSHYYFD